jgi:hypothetical protein
METDDRSLQQALPALGRIEPDWIQPSSLPKLLGTKTFSQINVSVAEFWCWAFNDLRMNTIRGTLAEFLVALALEVDTSVPRKEWQNYDLELKDGTRIEVKSSGYWQSWKQKQASTPEFSGLITRKQDDETNTYTETPEVWADLYVFALQGCDNTSDYKVLEVEQWQFWVVHADAIRQHNLQKVRLPWIKRNAVGPVPWSKLSSVVQKLQDKRMKANSALMNGR